jgi:hypothetical protein
VSAPVDRRDCATVRVVGDRLKVTYMNNLAPPPASTGEQIRTISAWGERAQQHLARLHVGIVGAGSVGSFIAEGVARTGFEDVIVIDYDRVERKNLDRLLYATRRIIRQLKAFALGDRLREVATARRFGRPPCPSRSTRGRGSARRSIATCCSRELTVPGGATSSTSSPTRA